MQIFRNGELSNQLVEDHWVQARHLLIKLSTGCSCLESTDALRQTVEGVTVNFEILASFLRINRHKIL